MDHSSIHHDDVPGTVHLIDVNGMNSGGPHDSEHKDIVLVHVQAPTLKNPSTGHIVGSCWPSAWHTLTSSERASRPLSNILFWQTAFIL
ncbi:unnamed protein product [Fusarium venenatum]|uniref:Uncharacterized protein n=1 Tax=Fusarium venenatum TaxID=56646 RepID=A0A2L2TAP3_9HYPO|nr:uncharacterized protein FVRRES_08099 [Fusarium venenatum]CEI68022.1 unnamed protein product [Fusarium venenatum]